MHHFSSPPSLSDDWIRGNDASDASNSAAPVHADDSTADGSDGEGSLIWLVLGGAAITVALFIRSHLEREKRLDMLKRLRPISQHTSLSNSTTSSRVVRVALLNPTSAGVTAAAKRAFSSLHLPATETRDTAVVVDVVPTTMPLFSGCDGDRSSVAGVKAVAEGQVVEAYERLAIPCLVHLQCLLVNGSEPELFMSPAELVRARRGGAALEMSVVNIVAWTVDGKTSEVATLTATGTVDANASTTLSSTLLTLAATSMRLDEDSTETLFGSDDVSEVGVALHDVVAVPYSLFVDAALRMELRHALVAAANGVEHKRRRTRRHSATAGAFPIPNWIRKRFGLAPPSTAVSKPAPEEDSGEWSVCVLHDAPGQDGQVRHFQTGVDAVSALLDMLRLNAATPRLSGAPQHRRVVLSEGGTTLFVWRDPAAL